MPILNSSYHAVKYAELRIGSILKVCRFVIRHITQTETQTETEANFTHWKTQKNQKQIEIPVWVVAITIDKNSGYHGSTVKKENCNEN